MAEIVSRLNKLVSYKGLSARAFALRIGTSSQVFGKYLKDRAPSFEVLSSIVETFDDVSAEWLLTGKGSMLKTEQPANPSDNNYSIQHIGPSTTSMQEAEKRMQRIPIFELPTMLNLNTLFADKQKPTDFMMLPNLPKCDGAVYMRGDMMHPDIQSGDIIVYRKVRDLKEGLFLGHMYLLSVELEGEEYIMVQSIHKSSEKEHVKLVSRNEKYPPKDVPVDSIKTLAMIKASVRYNTMM